MMALQILLTCVCLRRSDYISIFTLTYMGEKPLMRIWPQNMYMYEKQIRVITAHKIRVSLKHVPGPEIHFKVLLIKLWFLNMYETNFT